MDSFDPNNKVNLLLGDCRQSLKMIPDGSIQTCVTSPPYYGLRDYGVGDQIGIEPTPEEYVNNLLIVFREVWRTLAKDGTLWLNLGDSYASSWASGRRSVIGNGSRTNRIDRLPKGIKEKDLIGIPWMVAFALRDDGVADLKALKTIQRVRESLIDSYEGKVIPDKVLNVLDRLDNEYSQAKGESWYLRSDIIWSKPNPMPESVTDRPTKAHEYIFLLSKSQKYYYDHEAIKEPIKQESIERRGNTLANGKTLTDRNKRSVWEVTTKPYAGAHFATFPPDLIEPCILAGSREGEIVLDPFNGSGTTGAVALKHHRKYTGCEANPEYLDLTNKRLSEVQPVLFPIEKVK